MEKNVMVGKLPGAEMLPWAVMANRPLRLLELFGGIGAPRKALERLGIPVESVDYVEIDKHACKSYNAIYNESYDPQDVRFYDKEITVDLLVHGSPCQTWSSQNSQSEAVFEGSEAKSARMYDTLTIVAKNRPKYVLWENVPGILRPQYKSNFDNYLQSMSDMGYTNTWEILNAADYSLPQGRKRVYVVSILGEHKPFVFPEKQQLKVSLHDLLETDVDDSHYLSEEVIQNRRVTSYNSARLDRCLLNSKNIHPTICASYTSATSLLQDDKGIRRLTPLECWRLMGFDDEDFNKAQAGDVSEHQLYRQSGNSICIPVLEAIFKQLFRGDEDEK